MLDRNDQKGQIRLLMSIRAGFGYRQHERGWRERKGRTVKRGRGAMDQGCCRKGSAADERNTNSKTGRGKRGQGDTYKESVRGGERERKR